MRYGIAIRTAGDPRIAGALAAGIAAGTRREESEAVRRVAMWQHSPEKWREMTLDARRRYRRNRRPKGLGKGLLIGYALICYGVSRLYRWQGRILERRSA